jgi:enoyl-CoA hydratase/carnithine racemase
MSEDVGTVTTEKRGHVYVITVDRVKKRNAVTPEMLDGIDQALQGLEDDNSLWAAVLTFAGKHTTGGLELTRFFGDGSNYYENLDPNDTRPDVFALRRRCKKPVVMAVQGITFTIAIEMMLAADIVVAADDCRFCQLEAKRGLAVLGGGHARYVQRAGWGNAMYHLMRADEFDSARALQLGFVQEVVPAGEQIKRAIEIGREICKCAPLAVQEIKRAAAICLESGEQASLDEIDRMRDITANSEDAMEGVKSFIERRDAVFQGK